MQMNRLRRWIWVYAGLGLLGLLGGGVRVGAQGTLSQQVLQLLSRTNSWVGQNTFYNMRIPKVSIPGDTAARIYADASGNLYYDGGLIAGSGGGVTPHNFLSTTHPDTVAASPTRGAVVAGNSTPAWAAVSPSTGFVQYNGTDTVFSTSLANGTSIPAGQLTGSLPAISGASLTSLNASNLGSGTVPTGRLTGVITNAEVNASAAIAYSKLALTGSVVNADISSSAAIAYSKLNLSNSLVAGDLTSGSVTMAKINQSGASSGQAIVWNGSAWAPASVAGGGTVTSVGLALPGIFSVSGSPVTSSGTLTGTLASQTANRVWAAPDGSAGAPTFRALVNADLPTSGVSAGTYPSVTVNDRGIVTAAGSTIDLTAVGGATILPAANGGTGLTTVTAATTLVANGSAWVSTALPACTRIWTFDTATRLFSCATTTAFGTLTADTPWTLTQSWNNGGVTFNGWSLDVTDSASSATSLLMRARVGGTTEWSVQKNGMEYQAGVAFASLGTPANGTMTYCTNCAPASDPCTGASTGAMAFRRNGAWSCF